MTENEKNLNAEAAEAEAAAAEAEDRTGQESEAPAENPAEPETDEKLSHGEKKKVKKLEARVAELEKKLAESDEAVRDRDDKYLRLAAEYDNYRRRTSKEKESIFSDAYGEATKQLLPVIDNLERAAAQTGDAAAIRAGVEMTLKAAVENLGKLGITAFGEVGEEFDPNRHTAVFHIEDDSFGENVIAEVLQRGYARGDKIIRYAVVKVAN